MTQNYKKSPGGEGERRVGKRMEAKVSPYTLGDNTVKPINLLDQ